MLKCGETSRQGVRGPPISVWLQSLSLAKSVSTFLPVCDPALPTAAPRHMLFKAALPQVTLCFSPYGALLPHGGPISLRALECQREAKPHVGHPSFLRAWHRVGEFRVCVLRLPPHWPRPCSHLPAGHQRAAPRTAANNPEWGSIEGWCVWCRQVCERTPMS